MRTNFHSAVRIATVYFTSGLQSVAGIRRTLSFFKNINRTRKNMSKAKPSRMKPYAISKLIELAKKKSYAEYSSGLH